MTAARRSVALAPTARYRHPGAAIGLIGAAGAVVVGVGAGLGPVEGAAALVAVAFAVLVLERPAVGALTLVAATPVISGLRRGLPVPGLRLSEILIVGLAALVLLGADRTQLRPWRALDWIALAYVAATLALGGYDILVYHRDVGNDTVRALAGPLQYLLLYRAVLVGLPDARDRARALALLLVMSVPVSVLALMQYLHLLGVRGLIPHLTGVSIDTGADSDAGGTRATSTFPHWQVLAPYAWWIALLAVALLVDDAQRVLRRGTLAVILGLAIAAAVTTVTFVALIGIVVGALALAALAGHGGRLAAGIVVAAVLVALGFGGALERRYHKQFDAAAGAERPAWVPQTVDYRYRLWTQQYFPTLSGKWLTGYGPDLPPSVRFPYTESVYMTMLLRGGLVLLGVFLALMGALFLAGMRARDGPEAAGRAAGRVTVVAVALLVAMHFMEPYFLDTGMAHLLWITAALVSGAAPAPRRAPALAGARPRLAPA
jgi:hypothetical protein